MTNLIRCIVLLVAGSMLAEEPKAKPEPFDIHKDESALIESLKARLAKAEEQLAATQRACQTDSVMLNGALNALREFVNRPANGEKTRVQPRKEQLQ